MTAHAPELNELERVIARAGSSLEHSVGCEVRGAAGQTLPVHVLALGNPNAPACVGYFGGVHGLERIGSAVVIAWLDSLVSRLSWDTSLHQLLDRLRIVFIPIVNPGGMLRGTRANPEGVDLMRNAPIEARDAVPFLVGGQRISAGLPWYRGRLGDPMQAESALLCDVVQREMHGRAFSLALDCHSGFGMRDRLWFPMAHERKPIAHLAHLHALNAIFEQSNNHHPYAFEPQSRQYLTHGDLWDYSYMKACERSTGVFLPLTLEMGSWLWVRKNPRQLFSRHGVFNPLIEHRQQRVLRRHFPLLDFTLRAAASADQWLPQNEALQQHRAAAIQRWYTRHTH